MLSATSATKGERNDDSSDDTDDEAWANARRDAGDLTLVKKTLQGISSTSAENGTKGFGRHAETIRLGTVLWQSEQLSAEEKRTIHEVYFDAALLPTAVECKKLLTAKAKEGQDQIAPFGQQTSAYSFMGEYEFKKRIRK